MEHITITKTQVIAEIGPATKGLAFLEVAFQEIGRHLESNSNGRKGPDNSVIEFRYGDKEYRVVVDDIQLDLDIPSVEHD